MALILIVCIQRPVLAQISLGGSVGSGGNGAMSGPSAIYGTWGTLPQCLSHRQGQGGPYHATTIGQQWMNQGPIYCFVHWIDKQESSPITKAKAAVRCGEDSLMEYVIRFELKGEHLNMRWSTGILSNEFQSGEMKRCN